MFPFPESLLKKPELSTGALFLRIVRYTGIALGIVGSVAGGALGVARLKQWDPVLTSGIAVAALGMLAALIVGIIWLIKIIRQSPVAGFSQAEAQAVINATWYLRMASDQRVSIRNRRALSAGVAALGAATQPLPDILSQMQRVVSDLAYEFYLERKGDPGGLANLERGTFGAHTSISNFLDQMDSTVIANILVPRDVAGLRTDLETLKKSLNEVHVHMEKLLDESKKMVDRAKKADDAWQKEVITHRENWKKRTEEGAKEAQCSACVQTIHESLSPGAAEKLANEKEFKEQVQEYCTIAGDKLDEKAKLLKPWIDKSRMATLEAQKVFHCLVPHRT